MKLNLVCLVYLVDLESAKRGKSVKSEKENHLFVWLIEQIEFIL